MAFLRLKIRVLKQAVRRNMESFPEDFMFKPTRDELNSLIYSIGSQFVMLNENNPFGGYNPFVRKFWT